MHSLPEYKLLYTSPFHARFFSCADWKDNKFDLGCLVRSGGGGRDVPLSGRREHRDDALVSDVVIL